MRTVIVTAIATLVLTLAWPATDPAVAQSKQARSYNYCWQLAANRGWTRNTWGERQFIRRCMRGRTG
jgi:hypothetical protein